MDVSLVWAQTTHNPWAAAGFAIAMFLTAVFLILLVLVQRGRGGGLAGAFGGMGGQSAFGAKAGDTFTKITIYASTFWILLCMAALVVLNPPPPADAAPEDGISATGGAGAGSGEDSVAQDAADEGGTAEDSASADGTGDEPEPSDSDGGDAAAGDSTADP